jgi:hypothetical protein
MRRHMAVSVVGARARLADPHDRNMAKRVLGMSTVAKARRFLDQAEAEGLEVIPFDSCDNHDEKGHCLGHTDPDLTRKDDL